MKKAILIGMIALMLLAGCNQADVDRLKSAQSDLKDYQVSTDLVDECTHACAGENYKIPAFRAECHSSCYQIYYQGGPDVLKQVTEQLKAQQG